MKTQMNWKAGADRAWRGIFVLLIATGLLCGPRAAWGQVGSGSIHGIVQDPSGAVIPNAVVSITQTSTGTVTAATANQSGAYVFPSLLPASYSLTVTAPGFKKYVSDKVLLQADQAISVNVVMTVGSSEQSVEVLADTVQLNTTTGTLSQVISTQPVNDLPLNGRNAAQLTTLVAGVVTAPAGGANQGPTKTFPTAVTISANGSIANQTNYMLDGGNNLDEYTNVNGPFPFPDALQEFSVQTSNYNAEYGQNAAAVVSIVTKSGGKNFHGDVFEYLRNGVFNARNYFASTVDPLKRNQFGGTIGGPVKIPNVSSGEHTFFFFGYQKTILHDLAGGKSAFVPTAANLKGDFSALESASNPANPLGKAVTIVDPLTGLPFPNNQIPVQRFDPAAVAFSKALPGAGGNGQVFFQNPIVQGYDEYLGRVDQEFGAKDRFFAHYYYNDFNNNGVLNPSNLLTYSDMSNIRFQSALLSETHIFTNNLLNNLVVNYSREISVRGPLANAPDAASFGVNIYQPAQKSIQGISASGFFQVGDNPQATFQRNNYTLADDLHWIKGRHSMGFGVHAELSKFDINSLFQLPGTFTFNSNTTNYALASFLLGYLYQFNQGSGQYLNVRNHFLGFYGQDNWQITKRFSLNYGLRYEPYFPWRELRHRISQFNPAAYNAGTRSTVYRNAPPGLLFPGDPGVPEQGVRNSYTDIMPRVGFAWDVFGTGKTSLRGGGGVFYDTRTPGSMLGQGASATPFSVSVTLTQPIGTFSNPYAGISNPFPVPTVPSANTVFPTPVTAYTFDPSGDYKVAVTYDWNLTGEQQITNNLLARIAYVGSHASHIFTAPDLNPAIYTPGSTLSTNQRRHYQPYSSIVEINMGGNIGYNSLQATLQQRMANGLTLMANYTFAKALDDLPYGGTGGYGNSGPGPGGSYVYPVTFANYKALDRGPADFDFRNTFSASYVWDLPRLVNGSKPLRAILNDWETTGIFQAQSGGPVTVAAGSDRSQTGLLQDRAQTVPGQYAQGGNACRGHNGPCVNWINPSAFTLPAIGSFGNVQKGAYRGPGYFDWDAGLLRNFHFTEQAMLQFRAEYFNILNRANFLDPVSSVSSGGFGSITSANDPRIAQLALKMIF